MLGSQINSHNNGVCDLCEQDPHKKYHDSKLKLARLVSALLIPLKLSTTGLACCLWRVKEL